MIRHVQALFRLVFFLCLSGMPLFAFADESGKKNVLLLYHDNVGNTTSWVELFDKGLQTILGDRIGEQLELNIEYTDLSRNLSSAYRDQLAGLFKMKYGETPPDLVIVNMNPYSDFLLSLCNDLFPDAKIVFALYDVSFLEVLDRFPGRATGVYVETGGEDSPALIQQVLPETENVFVIGGASPAEQTHIRRVSALFNTYADRFNTTFLIGTPLDQLLDAVSALPEHSVIYFSSYMADNTGRPELSHNALSLISKRANAPIFSFNDMYMAYGLLGGELISSEEMGKAVAEMAMRILDGESPGDIELFEITGRNTFNWKQMQKMGIDEDRLPAGSIIENRENSFFDKYKWRILFWVGVTILQSALIAYLIITLGLRKRAEKERIRLEAALRQAHKMESIGTLAGGIAHDFNNILSAMIGFTELTLMDLEEGSNEESNLQQVLKAGKRAKELVNQILAYARKTQEATAPVHIRSVVEDVLKLVRSTTPSSIEIHKNLTADSQVLADKSRLHQVLLNLCTNAVQAMDNEAGTLSVDASDVTLKSDETLSPGKYVKIGISDTGPGISRDHLELIFDPYFTTKEAGKGTGLGLSVVLGIVKGYGGKINVDSELNRGTSFTIYLPVSEAVGRTQPIRQERLHEGIERILFVDDEQAIARMSKQLLERHGYQVTCVADGMAALEIFKEKPDDFDIVITDMAMPRMNGDTLATKLGDIKPDVPVILCTGYSRKLLTGEIDRNRIKAVLKKPVSQKELMATVRQVLDGN